MGIRNPAREQAGSGGAALAGRTSRWDHSIRFHLIALVLITAAPVALFAGYMVQRDARLGQAALERGLQESVQALALAVDRELARTQAILMTLARSNRLARGDLNMFHEEASAAAELMPGAWIVLSEPSGRQVVNTLVSYGQPLPTGNLPELFRKAAETGENFVSNLFTGAVAGRTIISSIVPVIQDGRPWVLDMAFEPTNFNRLLAAQNLPGYAVAAITDAHGRIIARSREAGSYVGRMGPSFWLRGTANQTQGILSGESLAGESVYVAFRKSELSPWTVGLAVYREEIAAPLRQTMWTVVGGGAGLLALALLLAALVGKRIADSVRALAALASSLGQNLPTSHAHWPIHEVNRVRQALVEADQALAARMREGERLVAEQAARREAEIQSRNKDVFLATLGHELRSPLAGVLNGITVLDHACTNCPQAGHILALVRRQAMHLNLLLDELLDVARVSLDRISLRLELVDLRSVIELAAQAESTGIEQKGQTLTLALPEQPVVVDGDPLRLRQIVGNLLRNANKYSPVGSLVFVKLREHDGQALLSVTDTGVGIPADRLDAIFELFTRLPEGSQQPGLGIGLPLARRLVQLHRGEITASSDGPGRGATFTIHLPIAHVRSRESGA